MYVCLLQETGFPTLLPETLISKSGLGYPDDDFTYVGRRLCLLISLSPWFPSYWFIILKIHTYVIVYLYWWALVQFLLFNLLSSFYAAVDFDFQRALKFPNVTNVEMESQGSYRIAKSPCWEMAVVILKYGRCVSKQCVSIISHQTVIPAIPQNATCSSSVCAALSLLSASHGMTHFPRLSSSSPSSWKLSLTKPDWSCFIFPLYNFLLFIPFILNLFIWCFVALFDFANLDIYR